ncbi:hypothetical protein ABNF97_01655 [Plantactinospora sp. B6F1]|uniref:hypothetical protein n=1 Tax=Plantactinospora sp. B6F1 TaxID=3158971 RepID=UPI0032D945AA
MDVEQGRLIVYRRPDPGLDAAVAQIDVDVPITVADARFSLRQMEQTADRVMADAAYWRNRGITINGAGPIPDGSGVEVMTANSSSDEQRALAERYGEGTIVVRQGAAAVPPIGVPLRPLPTRVGPTP